MGHLIRDALRWVEHMNPQEWVIFAAVGIVIGFLCMRGLGQRSNF